MSSTTHHEATVRRLILGIEVTGASEEQIVAKLRTLQDLNTDNQAIHLLVTDDLPQVLLAEPGPVLEEPPVRGEPTGWGGDPSNRLIDALIERGKDTRNPLVLLHHAAHHRNEISMEKTYELLGWHTQGKKTARGITRTVGDLQRKYVDAGILPATAPRPIQPFVLEKQASYQANHGFRIPWELAEAVRERAAEIHEHLYGSA